jgi:HrpA-like RNA helicase
MASNNHDSVLNTFGLSQPLPTFHALKDERERLPVAKQMSQFKKILLENDVVIVSSCTGSGKTTQIPQYVARMTRNLGGKIGCTQPRVLTATKAAERVAREAGCELGAQVGYQFRGDDKTSEKTRLMYVDSCRILTTQTPANIIY